MSGTSDKARFYLEQAVPQLQEFKEKEIFTTVRLPTRYFAPTLPILFDLG
jgi:U3 small nucleolar RNA-associated protein 6